MNVQTIRNEIPKYYGLYVNPKKKNEKMINNKTYQYLGTAMYNGNIKIWLQKHNLLSYEQGNKAKDCKVNYYIKEKEIRKKLMLKLSKNDLKEIQRIGLKDFEKKHFVKIEENEWKFLMVRSDGKVIFYNQTKELKNVNVNDLKNIGTENHVHFYEYENKKYLQIARHDTYYNIWTSIGVPIYVYKYQHEFKKDEKR